MNAMLFLSGLVVANWVLLFVVWRRNVLLGRKRTVSGTRHGEILRRLGHSHLAAVRMLGSCSAEQAQCISPACATSRQDLVMAVAAVGELAEDYEGLDHNI